ncbi:MAG: AAA family ATPase [Clostridia bacterium]|nr:AAA family ATPase [Clostridia bacterium]
MIERFKEIKNIGTYKNADQIASCGFNKITIIYGNNSQGKSTFCDILKSLSHNDPSYIENRKSIGETSSPQVEINFGNKNIAKFSNGQWNTPKDLSKNEHIVIFDTEFVQNNVFTNSEIERKNKENFTDFILGSESIEIQKQLLELKEKNNKLDRENESLKKDIENYSKLTIEEFSNIKFEEDVKDLDALCLGLYQQIINLKNDRQNIENIKKLPMPSTLEYNDKNINQYNKINEVLTSNYKFSRQDIIENFNTHKKQLNSSAKNLDKWISDGFSIGSSNICPYCGASTDNNKLVESYITLFCESFIDYTNNVEGLTKVSSSTKELDELKIQVNSNLLKIQNLAPKIYLENIYNLQKKLDIHSVRLLTLLEDLLKSKSDIDLKINESIDDKNKDKYNSVKEVVIDKYVKILSELKTSLDAYNIELNEFIQLSSNYLKNLSIENLSSKINELEKKYKEKCDIVNRNINNEKFLSYLGNLRKIKENEAKSKQLKTDFEKTQSEFIKTFFTDIDTYFLRLGSHNYKIEQETSKQGIKKIFTLKLKYREKKIDSLRFVLSDSDKRALALSIFLSKLKNDKNLDKNIVVMDDPITSFDNERMTLFINILKEFSNANQIIILTHYADFYKKLVELMYSQNPPPALLKIQYLPNSNKIITVDRKSDRLLMNDYEQALYNMYAFIEGISHSYSSNDARTIMQKYLEYKFYYDIKSKNINSAKFEIFLTELKTNNLINDNIYARLNQKREEYNVNSHVFDNDSEDAKRNSVIDLQSILKNI